MRPAIENSPAECANCGAAIPRRARACPECGADERTGWRENDATRYDGLDLGSVGFAWLAAAGGLGAIVGSLYWGRRERGAGERVRAFAGSTLLLGAGWAMAGLPWAPAAFGGMAIAGFGIPGASVVLYAALQARVRTEHLGRTFAVVETATYVGGPLGFAVSPLLVDRVDPGLVVMASGLGIAVSGLIAAVWMKGLDRG